MRIFHLIMIVTLAVFASASVEAQQSSGSGSKLPSSKFTVNAPMEANGTSLDFRGTSFDDPYAVGGLYDPYRASRIAIQDPYANPLTSAGAVNGGPVTGVAKSGGIRFSGKVKFSATAAAAAAAASTNGNSGTADACNGSAGHSGSTLSNNYNGGTYGGGKIRSGAAGSSSIAASMSTFDSGGSTYGSSSGLGAAPTSGQCTSMSGLTGAAKNKRTSVGGGKLSLSGGRR